MNLVHLVGHCTLNFQIAGGTGRFQGASGVLTYTETALPVLADALNNPVFFSETGEITGTISGVAMEEESQDVRRQEASLRSSFRDTPLARCLAVPG